MADIDISELGSTTEIVDLSSFECAIDEALGQFDDCRPLWRGHAKIDWLLRAEVFREGPHGPYNETSLIRSFMTRAESRSPRCPPYDDRIGWLMLARHYGLPTRLLDWSHSPLVALYFAAQEAPAGQDGCVWALDAALLNQNMGEGPALMALEHPRVQEFVDTAFLVRSDPRAIERREALSSQALAIGTRELDMRIMVQQGSFTIHGDGTDLRKVALGALRAFRIPHHVKPNIRERLSRLGFGQSTLFPDLGALAEELKATWIV